VVAADNGGYEHSLNVWDVATGVRLAALELDTISSYDAAFSHDGHRLLTPARRLESDDDIGVLVWEVPGFTGKVPPWFGGFLRWIVQRKFNSEGELQAMEPTEWNRLRGQLETAAGADRTRYGDVARWFLASYDTRPLRPGTTQSRREIADRLVTPAAGPMQIRRALELDPANALALLALARFEADPELAQRLRDRAMARFPTPIPATLQQRIDALLEPPGPPPFPERGQ
jgi:hypothetical protein